MYRCFYDYQTNGDVLFIETEPSLYPDSVKKNGDVALLYNGNTLVGVNLFNISKVVKIHASGMIVTPPSVLIDAINPLLENSGAPALPYCLDSGYRVLSISSLEEHPLDEKAHIVTLSDGSHTYSTVSHYQNLQVSDLVVALLDGCIRFDGTLFKKNVQKNIPIDVEICSSKDLEVGDDVTSAYKPNHGEAQGEDFFLRKE